MTPKNAYGHLVPGDISAARWVDPKIARPNYVGKKESQGIQVRIFITKMKLNE